MQAFRIYHVLFAIGATVSYFSAEEFGLVHAWLGYGIAALIVCRLVLGLMARRGFAFRRLIPRLAPPPNGMTGIRHPAINQVLVLALLASVAGAAGTGVAMDRGGTLTGISIRADDEAREHGRNDREEHEASLGLIPTAYADEGERKEEEEGLLGELHEAFGSVLLPLALIHAFYLLVFRFDLARFMLFLPRRR